MRVVFSAMFVCLPMTLCAVPAAQAASRHAQVSDRSTHSVRHFHHATRSAHRSRYARVRHQRNYARVPGQPDGQQAWASAPYQTSYQTETSPREGTVSHGGLVTVQTAAGIAITVASSVASQFQGFISDLVAGGYRPRQIHCNARGGHVAHSNHYWGGACDIDQTARGRTASRMYHVADIAAKWGLRDGCTFRDCGHVDAARSGNVQISARSRRHREPAQVSSQSRWSHS
jgi:hypothetical protein